jgi:hypothetical protein
MAESMEPSACTPEEFEAARAAGLLIVSTEDENAIRRFADAIRKQDREGLGRMLSEEAAAMRRTGNGCHDARYDWMAAGVDAAADTLRGIDSATGLPASPDVLNGTAA